ncbi:MAG: pyridoxal 5'-phosphate synthase glutaminase subunit PdxT [Dehalococcoidia bacterium]|nr:pyridoxal 5'-phosphate synthase glutaminase subunit PdxT [Dehalococcoidia bacterium]
MARASTTNGRKLTVRPPTPTTWALAAEEAPKTETAKVGVLSLQGDFLEHLLVLKHLGAAPAEVRKEEHLAGLQGLIIPGGESTTIATLMDAWGLRDAICRRAAQGMAIWGSCAGMILIASRLQDDRPKPLGLMDITVARNAFGRQVDSFAADLAVPALGPKAFHAIFIRAPVIVQAGPRVEVLARLQDGTPVAARQGKLLATAFHPELTDDDRFHRYFLDIAKGVA